MIAAAPNKTVRGRLIGRLPETNPGLHTAFTNALHEADCLGKFLRQSGRFPFTARGDINTYAVFAETIATLYGPKGARWPLPTGIATESTCREFFSAPMAARKLVSLHSFYEIRQHFQSTDSRTPFALVTLGQLMPNVDADFVFFAGPVSDLRDPQRHFSLAATDLALLTPNTGTCPTFRTGNDAALARKIYEKVPGLVSEGRHLNPWRVTYRQGLFHSSNDAKFFNGNTYDALVGQGGRLIGNTFHVGADRYLPLYEGKLLHQYDHRFSTYEGATTAQLNSGVLPQPNPEQKARLDYCTRPRYWVLEQEVSARLAAAMRDTEESSSEHSSNATSLQNDRAGRYVIAFRDMTNATSERTAIFCFLPRVGVSDQCGLLLIPERTDPGLSCCLLGNLNALIFDYL